MDIDPRAVRARAIYAGDENMPLRKSHENPEIKAVYADFFGEAGGHKAHQYLHTTYTARKKYI